MSNENFSNYGYGVFILKSKNSLFNADFSHEPRQLPDEEGTFYATDKSLKYCIRKYVHDMKGDKEIFFWRRTRSDGTPTNLTDNYKEVFGQEPKKKDQKGAEKNLLTRWDVKIFGATFAEAECNVSITGTVQITYGINLTSQNTKYSNQILSPFQNSKSKTDLQRTLGNENKALESHLAFDFIVNPKTLPDSGNLTQQDVAWFKEGLCKGASYVNSASKIGSESEFLLYLESSENSTLPLLKELLDIKIEEGKTRIDMDKISKLLERFSISKVELYYEPEFVEVDNSPKSAKHFSIHTLKNTK